MVPLHWNSHYLETILLPLGQKPRKTPKTTLFWNRLIARTRTTQKNAWFVAISQCNFYHFVVLDVTQMVPHVCIAHMSCFQSWIRMSAYADKHLVYSVYEWSHADILQYINIIAGHSIPYPLTSLLGLYSLYRVRVQEVSGTEDAPSPPTTCLPPGHTTITSPL